MGRQVSILPTHRMKTPPAFISVRSTSFLAAGLGVGMVFGWALGRGSAVRSGATGPAEHGQGPVAGHGGTSGRGDDDSLPGRRSRGGPVAKKDSEALANSARAIFKESVKARRVALFERLVDRTPVEQMPELVALIHENDLRGNDSGEEWTRVWTGWAERDPQAAMDFFTTHDWTGWNDMATGEARNRTLASWALVDPEKARQFVEADAGFMGGDRAMVYGLVEGWSNADPEAAANWLFKNGLAMGAEYDKITAALRRKGGQEGLEKWFFGLDHSAIPEKDMMAFSRAMSPDRTATWIEDNMGAAWIKETPIVAVTARTLAQRDPQQAVQWALKTGLEDAMHFSVSTWCEKDLDAAGAWVKENASLPASAQAATVVMAHMNHRNPTAAREWAEGIPDKALRDRLLGQQ